MQVLHKTLSNDDLKLLSEAEFDALEQFAKARLAAIDAVVTESER